MSKNKKVSESTEGKSSEQLIAEGMAKADPGNPILEKQVKIEKEIDDLINKKGKSREKLA